MTKFFSTDATGVNTDIKRHRNKIEQMNKKILELERIPNKTEFDETVLYSYKNMLRILMYSNAAVVSKIGKRS